MKHRITAATVLLMFFSISASAQDSLKHPLLLPGTGMAFSIQTKSDQPSQEAASQTSQTGSAFLKSLILPGWGEWSVGHKTRARWFWIGEGTLWALYAAFRVYGGWKRSDYIRYARMHAGINSAKKEKSYYFHVSNYRDIYEYNEEMRRFRRYDDVYPVDADHFWQWESEAARKRFDRMRLNSELAFRNSTLVIAGLLVNHLVSAIDAAWLSRHNHLKNVSFRIQPADPPSAISALVLNIRLRW